MSLFSRRDFFISAFTSFGVEALCPRLFAAPAGWKTSKKPKLVFGAVSDTHIRTAWDGKSRYWRFPLKYFKSALEYFKQSNVDAVVHCGDFAHRGMAASIQFHADTWNEVFGASKSPVKLFVSGNHDIEGWTYNNFGAGIFPDKKECDNHIAGAFTADKWHKIWGEKYEPVWHKEVGGYHFIGQHWGGDGKQYPETDLVKFLEEHSNEPWLASASKPFFIIRHVAPGAVLSKAINKYPNAITLFGHAHGSAANWIMARLHRGNAVLEVPSCEPRGTGGLAGTLHISKVKVEGEAAAGNPRCAYVVRVYDDMLTVERREVGEYSGSLGPDWILPLGKNARNSFSLEARKSVIGTPQFAPRANLSAATAGDFLNISIPRADGNPDSRVYAYEIVLIGEDPAVKLHKCIFAAGLNLAAGREPNGGTTTAKIPLAELPPGRQLTIAVRPLSSLGTKGKTIAIRFKNNSWR